MRTKLEVPQLIGDDQASGQDGTDISSNRRLGVGSDQLHLEALSGFPGASGSEVALTHGGSSSNGGSPVATLVNPIIKGGPAVPPVAFINDVGWFHNNFDSTCTAQFEQCVVNAEQTLTFLFSNTTTVNVSFTEKALGTNDQFALTNSTSFVPVSYAALKAALPASDVLPATDPNPAGGPSDWSLPEAYARMLGLSSTKPAVDGSVTLNTSFNWSYGQDVTNGVIHELSEIMGRVSGLGDQTYSDGTPYWSTMDLFRYSAPGVHDYTDGRDGETTYFSSDGTTLSSNAGLSFNNQYQFTTKAKSRRS